MSLEKVRNEVLGKSSQNVAFNAKNYKNSPLVREFYRFVAKNGFRAEAFKIIQNASNQNSKKVDYLLNFDM